MLTMPATAVITEKEKAFCVVDTGGKAARSPIEIGLTDGKSVEVVSGLEEGEQSSRPTPHRWLKDSLSNRSSRRLHRLRPRNVPGKSAR